MLGFKYPKLCIYVYKEDTHLKAKLLAFPLFINDLNRIIFMQFLKKYDKNIILNL